MKKLRGGYIATATICSDDCDNTCPSVPGSDCPGCAPSNPTKDPVTPTV